MSFDTLGLLSAILKSVLAAGFENPTEVQAQTIPPELEGRDLRTSRPFRSCAITDSARAAARWSCHPRHFAAQLEWLAQHGYRVVRLSQLVGFLAGREALPPRSVVITFDDGYESVYRHAYPLLRKHGFPATLFVYTDFVGTGDGLSWPQLAEMAQSGLIDIQAHSKTHRNLIERSPGETDDRYRQAVASELRAPRELLERRLSAARVQVRHFAYPFGDANEVVLDAMTRQRYELGVTVNPGGNAFFAHPLMLRRTMIFGDHDLEDFKSRLQTSRRLGAPW